MRMLGLILLVFAAAGCAGSQSSQLAGQAETPNPEGSQKSAHSIREVEVAEFRVGERNRRRFLDEFFSNVETRVHTNDRSTFSYDYVTGELPAGGLLEKTGFEPLSVIRSVNGFEISFVLKSRKNFEFYDSQRRAVMRNRLEKPGPITIKMIPGGRVLRKESQKMRMIRIRPLASQR